MSSSQLRRYSRVFKPQFLSAFRLESVYFVAVAERFAAVCTTHVFFRFDGQVSSGAKFQHELCCGTLGIIHNESAVGCSVVSRMACVFQTHGNEGVQWEYVSGMLLGRWAWFTCQGRREADPGGEQACNAAMFQQLATARAALFLGYEA